MVGHMIEHVHVRMILLSKVYEEMHKTNFDMLQRVSGVEDLGKSVSDYVDCYVSTDAMEMGDVLLQMGFLDNFKRDRKTLYDVYLDCGHSGYGMSLISPKMGFEIDCVDIPLEEALGKKGDIEFMAQSKFRVYVNGSSNVDKILLPIIKALVKKRQNMALFNDANSSVCVQLSRSYR